MRQEEDFPPKLEVTNDKRTLSITLKSKVGSCEIISRAGKRSIGLKDIVLRKEKPNIALF